MTRVLRLLISNDDGVFAPGVRTLANTCARAGYQVTVVSPDRERSATGHGLTLHRPIRAEIVSDLFESGVVAWSCSGTPSDCVKFALSAVVADPPDFVVSGINQGSNLGTDILYSGTVSAAMEGLLEGITSIAVSLASFNAKDFQPAADFIVELLQQVAINPFEQPTLLNVNVPALPQEAIRGVLLTRQGLRRYTETFQKRLDPRGKTYYWLAGEIVEELPQPEHLHLGEHILTDVQGIQENYITITPLQYNLTDVNFFNSTTSQTWINQINQSLDLS